MISFTDKSVAQIRQLEADKAKEGQLLHICRHRWLFGFPVRYVFDEKKEEDKVLESNGVSFLIDETSLEYLNGSVVDFDDGLNGKGFDIQNPNANNTCGCGRSFN